MIVEIKGVKIDVDERYAKKVESYKVGDPVQVLVKGYGETYTSYPGIIVEFCPFVARPTIVVAYLKADYSRTEMVFVDICADTKDIEICPCVEDRLRIDRAHALRLLDMAISKAAQSLEEAKAQKRLFEERFGVFVQSSNEPAF